MLPFTHRGEEGVKGATDRLEARPHPVGMVRALAMATLRSSRVTTIATALVAVAAVTAAAPEAGLMALAMVSMVTTEIPVAKVML